DIAAGNIKEYTDAGVNDVCAKPIDLPHLLKSINKLIGEEIHTSKTILSDEEQRLQKAIGNDGPSTEENFLQLLDRVTNIIDQRSDQEKREFSPTMENTNLEPDVMATLIAQYQAEVIQQCAVLKTAIAQLVEDSGNKDARGELTNVFHIIKGMGGTFGHHLFTEIASRGDDILKSNDFLSSDCIRNLSNHVDALSLIAQENLSGNGGKAGRILLAGLKNFQ
ncbi:MAG: hypothetical protein JKY04_00065, partial [Sneathiella sp.]|nr:hypothetical protein [Sneathiella sp.]